jgi:hypothetical protein
VPRRRRWPPDPALLLQLLHRQALAVGQAHIVVVQVVGQPVGQGLGMGKRVKKARFLSATRW